MRYRVMYDEPDPKGFRTTTKEHAYEAAERFAELEWRAGAIEDMDDEIRVIVTDEDRVQTRWVVRSRRVWDAEEAE